MSDEKQKKRKGLMGVDWNGDGDVSPEEDEMTLEVLEEANGVKAGRGACALYLAAIPVGIALVKVGAALFQMI